MLKLSFAWPIAFIIASLSCSDKGTEMLPPNADHSWSLISAFAEIDVRYTIESRGVLYLAGVNKNKINGQEGYGVIYSTTDAERWSLVRQLRNPIGPLALHNDTIYAISDSLYMIAPEWRSICKPEPLSQDPSAIGDMVFLGDSLYAMQSLFSNAVATYRIGFDGTVVEIFVRNGNSYGGSKFIKGPISEPLTVYVRGQYYLSGFYRFDGRSFSPVQDGLSQLEFDEPPTNSLGMHCDTLIAGFRFPSSVKFLNNDRWYSLTDTMPYSRMYERFGIKTEPTAITFAEDRLFVATSPLGVLEWNGSQWIRLSEGLPTPPISGIDDMFNPIAHLVYFDGKLLAAYGQPAYAPWGGTGLYILSLEGK